jgi:hypothetical protein
MEPRSPWQSREAGVRTVTQSMRRKGAEEQQLVELPQGRERLKTVVVCCTILRKQGFAKEVAPIRRARLKVYTASLSVTLG